MYTIPGLVRVVLVFIAALIMASCGQEQSQTNQAPMIAASTDHKPATRTYIVGTDASYPPYESLAANGDLVGFDIELMRAIAQRAGIDIRWRNTPWQVLFDALKQGDVDMVISAVSITEERRQSMLFGLPYLAVRQMVAIRGSQQVKLVSDLRGLNVGVQAGTLGEDAVSRMVAVKGVHMQRFESSAQALKALNQGLVDAMVGESGVLLHHLETNPNAALRLISDPTSPPVHYGVSVRLGEQALIQRLNEALAQLVKDGTYRTIFIRHFGHSNVANDHVEETAAAFAPTVAGSTASGR